MSEVLIASSQVVTFPVLYADTLHTLYLTKYYELVAHARLDLAIHI